MNRLCCGNSTPDFSEIIKPFKIKTEFLERYQNFLRTRNIKPYTGELYTVPSVRVLSNGPNGKPKWQTAEVEAYALIHSELNVHFKNLCQLTGNIDLYNYMEGITKNLNRTERIRLRYITSVRDKGNKCRLVAISDY